MNIERFTKENLKQIREILQNAINETGITGVEFVVGNASFTPNGGSVTFQLKGTATEAHDAERRMWLERGMAVEEIRGTVGRNGEVLVEYAPKNWKMPFIYEKNGQRYKTSAMGARRIFNVMTEGV